MAMAGSVLTEAEQNGRTLIIDLGAGTADVTLVEKKQPVLAFTLPVAGRHITNDISVGLGISLDVAEQLKVQCGTASVEPSPKKTVKVFDCGQNAGIPQKVLTEIIEARLREIFLLIEQSIIQAGHCIPPFVVLAGGTAMLSGISILLASMWESKVRISNPPYLKGTPVNFNNAAYVSAAAMCVYATDLNFFAEKMPKRPFSGVFDKFSVFWKAFSGI
jgi:cell division protein FtsA